MIHLECGSGWCASQGTPDRDCGDVRSPACSSNPVGFGPHGSHRPPSAPASYLWAGVPQAEVCPESLPSLLPLSPLLAEVLVAQQT